MNVNKMINYVLYGNPQGTVSMSGKSSTIYNDFIESVFRKQKMCIGCEKSEAIKTNNTLCQACWNDAEGIE